MPILRASFSFLNLWSQGRHEEAILSYFHVPRPTPPQYIQGKKFDEYAQKYITKHGTMPPEWGGNSLGNPITQMRHTVPYNALCSLTGIFDIYDKKTHILYELKTGKTAARSYANTHQVPLYLLLCARLAIPVKEARIIRYNPLDKKHDVAILYPTDRLLKKAENYLDSLVPEIYQYFQDNDLFNKYIKA